MADDDDMLDFFQDEEPAEAEPTKEVAAEKKEKEPTNYHNVLWDGEGPRERFEKTITNFCRPTFSSLPNVKIVNIGPNLSPPYFMTRSVLTPSFALRGATRPFKKGTG